MINFNVDLFYRAEKDIKEVRDFKDLKEDIDKIDFAMKNIVAYDGIAYAKYLDNQLRKKYPIINKMVEVANNMPKIFQLIASNNPSVTIPELESLRQDRCGIICDYLLKKQYVSSIEQCISSVTE